MRRSPPPKRKKPLARESKKKRQMRERRRRAVEDTHRRFGICQLWWLKNCKGGLEAHEVVKRSALPGSQYDSRLQISLCHFHNGWVEDNPTLARRYGASITSWAYKMHGEVALKDATKRRREGMLGQIPTDDPFWA